jgi:hypothetical protein
MISVYDFSAYFFKYLWKFALNVIVFSITDTAIYETNVGRVWYPVDVAIVTVGSFAEGGENQYRLIIHDIDAI